MPTRDELALALKKADAAGAADDARKLAAAIRDMDTTQPAQAPVAPPAPIASPPVASRPALQNSFAPLPPAGASYMAPQPERSFRPMPSLDLPKRSGLESIENDLGQIIRGEKPSQGTQQFQSGLDKLGVKTDGRPNEQADIIGGLGDLVSSANYGVRDWWRHTGDKDKAEMLANMIVETSGTGTIGRELDNIGRKTGNEFLQTDAFKTDENYNPVADAAGYGLNAMSWSTRNAVGGLVNPRAPGMGAVKRAAADVATNFTMGGSDLAGAGVKGVGKLVGEFARKPGATLPPINQTAVPVTRPAQPAAAAPPPVAPPPGSLQPVATPRPQAGPVSTEYRNLPPKVQAAFTRLLENSGVEPQRIPAIIGELDKLPTDRATMVATELIRKFGKGDADLMTNIQAVGREGTVNTPTGEGDYARRIVNDNIREAMDQERPFLEGVAERTFGPGAVATKEQIDASINKTRGEYRRILNPKKPYGNAKSPSRIAEIEASRQELATYLKRPDVADDIPDWVRKDAVNILNRELRASGLSAIETGKISGFTWAEIVEAYPTQIAHALQSSYATAAREAGKSLDMRGGAMARDLGEKRGRSRIRANASNPDDRGYGLLYMLEQAIPGYRDARIKFGHEMGEIDAVSLPERMLSIADDETKAAQFLDDLDELTPDQLKAAENQVTTLVRNAMNKKLETPTLAEVGAGERGASTPNLQQLSKRGFLELLPKAFGEKGKELADAIRLSRANMDTLGGIDPKFGSRTKINDADATNAPNLYEDPKATSKNPIDNLTAISGVAGASQVLTNPVVGVPLLGLAGARWIYNKIKNGKKLTPEERTQFYQFMFALRRGEHPELRLEGPDTPPQLPAPDASTPPRKPEQAGFFSSGSKPSLDMSEPARMQRAREQGFDVDTPYYHGTSNARGLEEFDRGRAGSQSGSGEDAIFLTDSPARANRYAGDVPADPTPEQWEKAKSAFGHTDESLRETMRRNDPTPGVFKTYVRGPVREIDWVAYTGSRRFDDQAMKRLIAEERARGRDARNIRIRNMDDGGGDPQASTLVVLEPRNIRSTTAAFDPSQSGSSKLLAGFGGSESVGAGLGATAGLLSDPDTNHDGVVSDKERAAHGMGVVAGAIGGGLLGKGVRHSAGAIGKMLPKAKAASGAPELPLSKDQRIFAPGKPDDLGFITSAEHVLANPPPRFRDAKALTADQWRNLMRDGGASKESFHWQIEPALKRLADEGFAGDIPKAKFEEALARSRGTLSLPPKTQKVKHELSGRTVEIPFEGQGYDRYVAPGSHSNYKQHVLILPKEQGQGYKSHNWKSENPVGHVRTTNRTSANGEKVLHVEELQSDLHQEGAKYGYRGDGGTRSGPSILQLADDLKVVAARYNAWADAQKGFIPPDLPRWHIPEAEEQAALARGLDAISDPVGKEYYREAFKSYQRYNEVAATTGGKMQPPRAPMENWEEPFIRFALKQAADEGIDVVTFPTHGTLHKALQNEGTAKFYDQRIPAHLASVAKSLGLKVESAELPMSVGFAGNFAAGPRGKKFAVANEKIGEWYFDAGEFDTLAEAQAAAARLNKKTQILPAIRLTPEAKSRLSEGVIMDAKDPGRRAPKPQSEPVRQPPLSNGFSLGGKGVTDALTNAYGDLKRGLFPNDPRQLNEAAEALQGMSPASRALVEYNARRDIPQSVMAAADTPPELAELVGRATSQTRGGGSVVQLSGKPEIRPNATPDKPIDAAAKQYQTSLADAIMAGQRAEPDLINLDPKAGPKGALEKQMMTSYDWTPAREAQQDATLASILLEGEKGVGGIPERSGALDRFREGTARGAQQPPLNISPRDENRLADLIFNPANAKEAGDMLNAPIKPWVSDLERKAIQVGVPATGLAAMIAGGASLYNQPGGEAVSDAPPAPQPERPQPRISDRLMPTNNPSEIPPELNGFIPDTRMRAQQRLMALGYAPTKLRGSGARFDDGKDGPELRRAVEAFQRENDLPVNGDLDPITLRTLWGGRNFQALPTMRNYGEELASEPR